jgi:hypothetical protein
MDLESRCALRCLYLLSGTYMSLYLHSGTDDHLVRLSTPLSRDPHPPQLFTHYLLGLNAIVLSHLLFAFTRQAPFDSQSFAQNDK